MIVVPVAIQAVDLAALLAHATPGRLDAVKYHLYKAPLSLTPAIALADFTECDFGGYAASAAVTWGTTVYKVGGSAVIYAPAVHWTSTDAVSPQNAYGYYVTDSAGTTLEYAEAFDAPVGFAAAGNSLVLVPSYALGPLAA